MNLLALSLFYSSKSTENHRVIGYADAGYPSDPCKANSQIIAQQFHGDLLSRLSLPLPLIT